MLSVLPYIEFIIQVNPELTQSPQSHVLVDVSEFQVVFPNHGLPVIWSLATRDPILLSVLQLEVE